MEVDSHEDVLLNTDMLLRAIVNRLAWSMDFKPSDWLLALL